MIKLERIKITKKNRRICGCTRRYEYKGTEYAVSSVFRPFQTSDARSIIITNDLRERFSGLILHDEMLTMQSEEDKICSTYHALSAGKERYADKK